MTTADDFLAAIREAGPKGDPSLWLRYADWLEDDERQAGDRLLAESIRLAMELEGMEREPYRLIDAFVRRTNGDRFTAISPISSEVPPIYVGEWVQVRYQGGFIMGVVTYVDMRGYGCRFDAQIGTHSYIDAARASVLAERESAVRGQYIRTVAFENRGTLSSTGSAIQAAIDYIHSERLNQHVWHRGLIVGTPRRDDYDILKSRHPVDPQKLEAISHQQADDFLRHGIISRQTAAEMMIGQPFIHGPA